MAKGTGIVKMSLSRSIYRPLPYDFGFIENLIGILIIQRASRNVLLYFAVLEPLEISK